MTSDGTLEALLRRDRWLVAAMLATVAAASWAYVLSGAGTGMTALEMTAMTDVAGSGGEGAMPAMTGMEPMAPAAWSPAYALLMLVMWWTMMVAMMLPAAAPMVLLFAAIQRRRGVSPHALTDVFLLGYLLVWGGCSVAAVALQWGFAASGILGPDMALAGAALGGRASDRCRALPAHAAQAGLPAPMPASRPLPRGALAQRRGRRAAHGLGSRSLLSRLLLGIHAAVVRRRCDESLLDRRAGAVRAVRARSGRLLAEPCGGSGAGGIRSVAVGGDLKSSGERRR